MPRSRLQREIRQTKPFESPGEEAYLNLLRTQAVLSAPLATLFKEHGLSQAAYNVMRILRGAGEPIPSREIGRRLVTRVPDVTRLVDRLVRAGLAKRARAKEDRRVVLIEVTKAGRALLGRLDAPVRRLTRDAFRNLAAAEIHELIRLLEMAREEEE